MKKIRLLIIGDPEGKVRGNPVKRIAQRFLKRGDLVVFTGDYFSNPLTEYYAFKRGEPFPERKVFEGLTERYKVILIYGNKDLQSRFFGLDKKRARERNVISVAASITTGV